MSVFFSLLQGNEISYLECDVFFSTQDKAFADFELNQTIVKANYRRDKKKLKEKRFTINIKGLKYYFRETHPRDNLMPGSGSL